MTTAKAKSRRAKALKFDWGESSGRRGLAHYPEARAFVQTFPPPRGFSVDAFDAWAEEMAIYERPLKSITRDDPRWLKHLERRARLKTILNEAGGHARLIADGLQPFAILIVKPGVTWEVLPSHDAYKDARLLKPVDLATTYMRRRVASLLQAANWEVAPVFALEMAREMFLDITHMEKDVHTTVERIIEKYGRLEARLVQALKSGRPVKSLQPYLSIDEMEAQ
jgi:hypothetical protein